MFGNFKIKFLFLALMFLASFQFVSAKIVSVENNASAVSETGGNIIEGEGSIETGDAVSSVKVETKSGGSEEKIYIKTEAKAKANEEEVEIKTEGEESVSIKKESGGASAEVTAEIDADSNANLDAEETNSNTQIEFEKANETDVINNDDSEAGIFERTINRVKDFFKNIFF